jgi:catechol 2,3-dioxygenase-like lactoylglutathione lyase family enzyme
MHSSKVMTFVSTAYPDKARTFYRDVLGLTLVSEEPIALVFDVAGVMLRVSVVKKLTPQPFTVLGWQVPDLRASLDELAAKGVAFEPFGFPGQDADGVWTTPDGTLVAWFKDPDGNLLSLTQFPE